MKALAQIWTHPLLLAVLVAATLNTEFIQAADVPRQHHAWGRFSPGAWRTARVITETFDDQGKLANISTSETTTTLTRADADTFTLTIQSTVDVGGRRIVAEPQVVTQRYNGTSPGQAFRSIRHPEEPLEINGMRYICQVHEIEVSGASGKTSIKLYYCDHSPPYLLRRDSHNIDSAGNDVPGGTSSETIAIDMPFKVMGQMQSTTHVKVQQEHDKGSSVSLIVSTLDVPGGVVANTSKEVDASGDVVRRSTLELVGYGGPRSDEPQEQKSRRPRKMRKHNRR